MIRLKEIGVDGIVFGDPAVLSLVREAAGQLFHSTGIQKQQQPMVYM